MKFLRKSGLLLLAAIFSCNALLAMEDSSASGSQGQGKSTWRDYVPSWKTALPATLAAGAVATGVMAYQKPGYIASVLSPYVGRSTARGLGLTMPQLFTTGAVFAATPYIDQKMFNDANKIIKDLALGDSYGEKRRGAFWAMHFLDKRLSDKDENFKNLIQSNLKTFAENIYAYQHKIIIDEIKQFEPGITNLSGDALNTHLEKLANKLDTLGKLIEIPSHVHGGLVRHYMKLGADEHKEELIKKVKDIDKFIEGRRNYVERKKQASQK